MDPISNLVSAGVSMAMGNPIGAAASIGGLGLSIFGGMEKSSASQEAARISREIAGVEMKQDALRRKSMEISARRQQMEVLRNQQRARSLALANATSQGAQFGSGLQGGFGQIAGQTAWNIGGIQSGLEMGRQMFDLNAQISGLKMQQADAQGRSASAQGMTSLGGSIMQSAGPLTNLWKQAGATSSSTFGEDNKWMN